MPEARNGGATISYESVGQGPPIVLLHSFLCSGEMWREQVPELARSHRVINIDARGHGRSSHVEGPLTLDHMVSDTLAVLDATGVERAIWAGLSMGGFVALRAALEAPKRVAALILIDTDAGREGLLIRLKYVLMGLIVRALGVASLRGEIARVMFGATTLREQPTLVKEWSDRFADVHVASVLRVLEALMAREELTERLSAIAVPSLVVVGSEDLSLPPERSRRLVAALPGAQLREIPEAGHLSTLERPREVTAAMVDFLKSLA